MEDIESFSDDEDLDPVRVEGVPFVPVAREKRDALRRPWKIMDHYLVVQRWKPNFRPSTAKIGKMAIWIRLPEFPIEYFDVEMLMEVGRQLGKPIRLDTNTSKAARGKFARICV